ncbi:MAG: DUF3304 domain-containing protein [Thermomonas sp.]|uniref:DUF3304 domain-containing protein n=1 Tax=Thermomonas sp. TaxID=1971895 RepID=UPI001EC7C9F3|nr:DUF3304 domain-containing protein [Thermomonas sp.]MBV2208390.1 DUF3304 domain-containing protein [Thermomonas sp.]
MDKNTSMWLIAVALLVGAGLFGCTSNSAKAKKKVNYLSLFAFNYTDRSILDITVDGMWLGGASAYTNGGSAMGPKPPRNMNKQHTIKVHWRPSSRYDLKTNRYVRGEVQPSHDAVVPIKFPYPDNPSELVLHFYPDGHVEAEMVDLSANVFDFRRFPVPAEHNYNK